ncbi:hypothetical protein [Victivallis vadensis]|uniref:hypothetical protein n=1 Tax=Victivallis vadensis TaxID=172901 RepID=UPI00266DAD17|nr:hypothetical protein [Victivallis vadensis]
MVYINYHGQYLAARVRKNPENFPTTLAFQATGGILYSRSLKHSIQRGSRFPSTAAIPVTTQDFLGLTCRSNPGSTLYECFNALSPFSLPLKQTEKKIKHSMPYTAEA